MFSLRIILFVLFVLLYSCNHKNKENVAPTKFVVELLNSYLDDEFNKDLDPKNQY